jgi:ribosomal protein L11 methyltransferase
MVDKAPRVNNYTPMQYEDDLYDNIIPHELWSVRLNFGRTLSGALPEKLSAALEDVALSVFLHNIESTDGDNWELSLTTYRKPDIPGILARVDAVAAEENLPPLLTEHDIIVARLPEKDWLRHVHENFPPIKTDQFFIYGSHYTGEKPQGLIPLQIDAATAFGSGEHETTRGCLQALEYLQKDHTFKNGLDMGCGSGILAIAMIKFWPEIQVTAIDIDPESVIVTNRHAAMNEVGDRIKAEAGDGYNVPLVSRRAPYDIITANILANPLIEMSPSLAKSLQPGGYAVLSGLLARQQADVVTAHEKLGLKLVRAEEIGEWRALLMQKAGDAETGGMMRILSALLIFMMISCAALAQGHGPTDEDSSSDIVPDGQILLDTANTAPPPPTDEYNDVKPGMLLPPVVAAAPVEDEQSQSGASDVMTMDDIVAAYNRGEYDVVVKHLAPIAGNNYPQAEELLGIMYSKGQGVPENDETAVAWLTKAADAGRPLAQHYMSTLTYTGKGTMKDPVSALMWIYIAIVHYPDGPEKDRALKDRAALSSRLSRRDRLRAFELAQEWLKKRDEDALLDRAPPP